MRSCTDCLGVSIEKNPKCVGCNKENGFVNFYQSKDFYDSELFGEAALEEGDKIKERLEKELNLPVTFNKEGEMISLREWTAMKKEIRPPFYDKLSKEDKTKIIIQRYKQRDPFQWVFLSPRGINNEQAIKEIEKDTKLGKQLFRIEERTIEMLKEDWKAYKNEREIK